MCFSRRFTKAYFHKAYLEIWVGVVQWGGFGRPQPGCQGLGFGQPSERPTLPTLPAFAKAYRRAIAKAYFDMHARTN